MRCGHCGFRIRGKNHADGKHHKAVVNGKGMVPKGTTRPAK